MPLKAVFFDLDGTLLPMEQKDFVKSYFCSLAAKMDSLGFDPKLLIDGLRAGITAMVNNDGECTNEKAFWRAFPKVCGERVLEHEKTLEDFYANEFQQVQKVCGYNPKSATALRMVKDLGLMAVLATNPVFPSIAIESRIRWAGLDKGDFDYYTAYENSSYCKPNPKYYQAILDRLNLKAEDVLMVGNDVVEDMVAETVGMKVFLLTDHVINRHGDDITRWPHGGFEDLFAYLKKVSE